MNVLISQSDHDFALMLNTMLTANRSTGKIKILPQEADLFQEKISDYNLLILDDSAQTFSLFKQLKKQNPMQIPAVIFFFNPDKPEAGKKALQHGISYALPKNHAVLNLINELARQAIIINQNATKVTILSRQLEEADKAAFIGRISAGLAHDFNNILHLINGHAQAAMGFPDTEVKNASLDIIRDCCEQGQNIATQLAKLLKPKSPVHNKIAIATILETALQFMQYELTRCKIEIEKDFAADLRVICNEEQILQTFLNFLTNARDNMHITGGTLKISTRREKNTVLIEFADSGTGIEEPLLEKIFDPMFTTKNSENHSQEFGGSGLGLFISKNIIEQHNGSIAVQNRESGGTIFSISLPIAAAAKPARRQNKKLQTEQNPQKQKDNLDILVVEDEVMIQSVLKNLLSRDGHKVTLVDDGELALEKVNGHDYDLILSDLNMPNMTGLDFFKKAKEIKSNVKVVMITGDHFSADLQEAEEAGACGQLLKPFNKQEIDAVLAKIRAIPE